MNVPPVHKLSKASQLSLVAVVILLGAIFFTVNGALQQQNTASHASVSNILANPGCESGTADFSGYLASISTVTSPVHSGSYACRVIGTGASVYDITATNVYPNPTAGQTFSGYAYVRAATNTGGKVFVAMQEWNGSTMIKSTYGNPVTLTTSWQLVTNTTTWSSAGTRVVMYVVQDPGYVGQSFYVDDMFFSPGNFSGPVATVAPTTVQPTLASVPPAPTGLSATPGNGKVTLNWNEITGDWFWVYVRDVTAGQTSFTKLIYPDQTNVFTYTPATNGHTYQFKVSAIGQNSVEGPQSAAVSAVPSASTLIPTPTCAPPPACYSSTGVMFCLMPISGWCGFTPTAVPPTAMPTTAPTSSQDINVGYPSYNGNVDSGDNNSITLTQITTGATGGVAKSISIYIDNVNASPYNHLQAGIYADTGSNAPGVLLASSGSVTLTHDSWNTIPVNGISINPNTKYWIGFNVDGANTQIGWNNQTSGRSSWKNEAFGSWLNPYGTNTNQDADRYAIYLTYGPNGIIPTELPAPTSYPTAFPTSIPSAVPTAIPTEVPQPTDTPVPGSTVLALTVALHGIGNGGDSASPGSQGNMTPLRPSRTVTADIYDAQNQLVVSQQGTITYDSNSGLFNGNIDLGTSFQSGPYTVKIKTDQYLRALVPGIQTISAGQTNTIPNVTLIAGDINGDNAINIVDYNILIGCYSDLLPATDCNATNNVLADLTDDGHVNQFDYNLFLRELTNIGGQ